MSLPKEYWNPTPIDSLPQLAELRDMVLQHSESHMPKWRFRIAPDLVLGLQPQKPNRKYSEWFAGRAFEYVGANGKVFEHPNKKLARKDHALLFFELRTLPDGRWTFHPRRAGGPRMCRTVVRHPGTMLERRRRVLDATLAAPLRDRLVQLFQGDFFRHITPGKMLRSQCLCCGRRLEDPASMARMIGPECYGSATLHVSWLYPSAVKKQFEAVQ